MEVAEFAEIAPAFMEQVHTHVWCNVATVNGRGRPRSRVLHPIWEVVADRPVGWIATGRHTLKTQHIAIQPAVSLAYIAQPLQPVYVDCQATWDDAAETKKRIWDWFGREPAPLGYDLAQFFGSLDNPEYGVLKLTPWRVELGDLLGTTRVWHA